VDKVVHEARSVAGGQCSIQCFDNVDLETVVIVVECIMSHVFSHLAATASAECNHCSRPAWTVGRC